MNKTRTIAIMSALALAAIMFCFTTGGADAKNKGKESAEVLRGVTLTGSNYCFGCALKKSKGAKSQCGLHGHQHALKVTGAKDAKGGELKKLRGWVLHYLATDVSAPLLKDDFHGGKLRIKGNVYVEERVIEVTSFKEME